MGALLRRTVATAATLLVVACASLPTSDPPPAPDATPPIDATAGADRLALWQADLDCLERLLRERHAGLFSLQSERDFEASLAELRSELPLLRDDQIVVRMKAIAASIGSSHTGVWPTRGDLTPRLLPLGCVWLDDGILIAATDDANESIRGATILRMGDHDIDSALRAVSTICGHENEWYLRVAVPRALVEAETLSGLGLIDDPDAIPMTVRTRDGRERAVTIAPKPRGEPVVVTLAIGGPTLAFTRHDRPDGRIYGSRYVDDSRTLYVWYDACRNAKGETVADFAEATLKEIDGRQPQLVVVDLRRNGGGNSALLRPLIDGIVERPAIDDPKRLAVLVGPGTFSSAGLNAEEFRTRTNATIVGQPTGHRPNSWFECRQAWLPNTLMQVNYMLKGPYFEPGLPDSVYPDVLVPQTSADWLAGRDVTLERALDLSRADG